MAAYHEAQLAQRVARVGDAVDRYRADQLDPFEVDRMLLQYSRVEKELWTFCSLEDVEFAATIVRAHTLADW